MQTLAKHLIRVSLGIAVFLFFLNTASFAKYANGLISEILIYQTKSIVIGEKSLVVEIADSEKKVIKGLSDRKSLAEDRGMLFIFPDEKKYGIWMKDMNFPLDIIWINKNFEVVFIEENVSPYTYPKTFTPDLASHFVLEVNSGFVEKNNIKKGDLMTIL